MLDPRAPIYVPIHLQTADLKSLGHILQETRRATTDHKAARQAQRWAHKRAQEQLQSAKAANLSVPCSTPQEVQALAYFKKSMQHATNQLWAELDNDVVRIFRVLLAYKSTFASTVFLGKDPDMWSQEFGASDFNPRLRELFNNFKLYFVELAKWATDMRGENTTLAAELATLKEARKEASTPLKKAPAADPPVDYTSSSSSPSSILSPPSSLRLHAVHDIPANLPPSLQIIQALMGRATMQRVVGSEVPVISDVAAVEVTMGTTAVEDVVRPLSAGEDSQVEQMSDLEVREDSSLSKIEDSQDKPVSQVNKSVVADTTPVAESAVQSAIQPVEAAAPVSVVETAAEPEVQQAQASILTLYQQWQLREGSSGPAVPGFGKCPAGFHETTLVISEDDAAMQPATVFTIPPVDSAKPADPGMPAVPAVVVPEAPLLSGGASSGGSVLGSPSGGVAQPLSPPWAITAKQAPGAELSMLPAHQDDVSSVAEPQSSALSAPLHPTPFQQETTVNVQPPTAHIDPQHAQHAVDTSLPSSEAMQAVKGWALPVLRKIKGSTIGVEDLWVALQNSPTAEALAVCEASLGKSGHVTGFVQELLGRVNAGEADETVAAMDAADSPPPKLSKSQKRKLRRKAARAAPPSYPTPDAMEAAKGWAVPVMQRIKGSTEGVEDLWGSLQSTPVTEIVTLCEDRLGSSPMVTSFLNKLMRSLSGGEDGSSGTAPVSAENKLSSADKRKLRRWSKQQNE